MNKTTSAAAAIAIVLLCSTAAYSQANTFLQNPTAVAYSATTSVSKTMSALTPGSTIIAACTAESGTSTPIARSISDTVNSYQTDATKDNLNTTPDGFTIFSAHNSSSSALTITCNLSASSTGFLKVFELSGPPSSLWVDAAGTKNNNTDPSLALTLHTHDTVIGVMTSYNSSGWTNDTGFTLALTPTAGFSLYHGVEDEIDSGSGSTTFNWGGYSAFASFYMATGWVAYKSASTPSGNNHRFLLVP